MQSTRLAGEALSENSRKRNGFRVAEIANYVCNKVEGCNYIVATDHEKIVNFCKENNIAVMMTSENCKSGTERCWDVTTKIAEKPDFIVNLQGDNPLCPPWFIEQLIEAWKNDKEGTGLHSQPSFILGRV